MAQLLRPALIVALYALLLPVSGTLLDHHFVEWQHNHAHIYFDAGPHGSSGFNGSGGYRPGHSHVYETARSHYHNFAPDKSDPATPGGKSGSGLPGNGGVVYITSYDGAGAYMVYLSAPPAKESMSLPDFGDGPFLLGYTPRDVPPPYALSALPWKPPRV